MRHLLIWPDTLPRHAVVVDFGLPERSFVFLRPDSRWSWSNMTSYLPGTIVLDPLSARTGELRALINTRGFDVIEGFDACREHLERMAREARAL